MLLTDQQLRVLARKNPRLAYWYLQSPSTFPTAYNIQAVFTSAVPDVPLMGSSNIVVAKDLWITDIAFNVRRINAFEGSVFKSTSDLNNAKGPCVNVEVSVLGGDVNWVFTCNPTPIENIFRQSDSPAENCWYQGLTLSNPQSLIARFVLTRTLTDGEIPYEVNLTVKGIQLGCRGWNMMTPSQALELLRTDHGLDVALTTSNAG